MTKKQPLISAAAGNDVGAVMFLNQPHLPSGTTVAHELQVALRMFKTKTLLVTATLNGEKAIVRRRSDDPLLACS